MKIRDYLECIGWVASFFIVVCVCGMIVEVL